MDMPTLRQLRYLEALARFRHFGIAASHCAVTQPALSTQIQDLEKKLGVDLVERRYKDVQLTPVGREVAERAARILADVRDLSEFARLRAAPLSGDLRLGVIPTIAPYLLPPLLPRLRDRYPTLELHIRETQTQALIDELVSGSLDLLLLALPAEHGEIETLPLFEDRFVLALPPDREMKGFVRASLDLVKDDRLLLLEEGHCLREQALAFCEMRQAGNIDTFGVSSLSTIVQMVANGLGLTLLPEISVDVDARHGDIKLMRFVEPEPSRIVGLAWRATNPRRRDFDALAELILTTVPAERHIAARRISA
jgi:LysR family transcriptional regulator, hydrogen peroxide-inducible genes activator